MQDKSSMLRLRNCLGVCGMLLPFALLLFNGLFGGEANPAGAMGSISATYYSIAGAFFLLMMGGIGSFLLLYEGYDMTDRVFTVIAGAGAVVLAVFPTELQSAAVWNFAMLPMKVTNVIHLIGAFAFFGSMCYIVMFQFTKTSELLAPKAKWTRNIWYYTLGSFAVMALVLGFGLQGRFDYSVFIGEAAGLFLICSAWLLKGGALPFLKD